MNPQSLDIRPLLPWVGAACVFFCIVAMVGLAIILRFLGSLRSAVANELKRELSQAKEAAPVAVQTPLVVTPHAVPISRAEVEQMDKEAHGRMTRERKEVDARADKLEDRIESVDAATDTKMREINTRIDAIPGRTIALLNETKQLHQPQFPLPLAK